MTPSVLPDDAQIVRGPRWKDPAAHVTFTCGVLCLHVFATRINLQCAIFAAYCTA